MFFILFFRVLLVTVAGAQAVAIGRSAACTSTSYALQGAPVQVEDTNSYNISLEANCGLDWNVTTGTDVTSWFVDCEGNEIFTHDGSVARALYLDNNVLTISFDPSNTTSFNTNGPGTLTVQVSPEFLLGLTDQTLPAIYVGDYIIPTLSVTSTIQGTAYTHAKSTLKEHFGIDVEYLPNTDAKFNLELLGLDDSKIDSSNAIISLVAGDGYYPTEYTLNATSLTTSFLNGVASYTLSSGDLTLDEGGYLKIDPDSGREWSCLGGDGQGSYDFNFKVSGITYNGLPVAATTFPVHVYIHGYNYGYNTTSDANVKFGNGTTITPDFAPLSSKIDDAPQPAVTPIFTWVGPGDKPDLVDSIVDDFYITWPAEVDASELSDCDIVITLYSNFGKTLQLRAGHDFQLFTSKNETQIAVTYLKWPFSPVWTKLSLTVNNENLRGAAVANKALTTSYDIIGEYAHLVQQGGGGTTIDGTVTAYSFYGLANFTSVTQMTSPANYTLTITIDDTTYYYAESGDGTGSLVDVLTDATAFDASGVDDLNLQLIANTVYVTSRVNATATKTINGTALTFVKGYLGGAILTPDDVRSYLYGEPGFQLPPSVHGAEIAGVDADDLDNSWIYHEKWAWQPTIAVGFHGIDILPYTGKFEWTLTKGSTQQFEASTWPGFDEGAASSVEWSILGNQSTGTSISDTGLLTFADDETATSVAVVVRSNTDKSYNGKGTVNVEVEDPST